MNGHQKPTPKIGPNSKPSARPNGRNVAARPRTPVTWSEIDNQLIRDAVVAVCDAGAAIQFSATSDKGALVIKLYDGDNPAIKEYPHSTDEAEATLRWVVNMYADE